MVPNRIRKFLLLPVLILSLIGLVPLPEIAHASLPWSSPILIDSHTGLNELSSSLQASNGTLWIALQSNRNAQTTGRFDVIYKTYTNGVWSIDHNLTMSGQNAGPSMIQLSNGTIGIFWSLKLTTSYDIYYARYIQTPSGWSTPIQITSTILNDTQPSAAVGKDGTIWLVWTRVDSTNPSVPAIKQLYYKTYKSGLWSTETQLTTDSNQNYGSSVLVAKDGKVRVTWSKGSAGNVYQIYEKKYNGTSWSVDTQIVSSASTDEHPSMIQDRNGTLWLFWGRLIVVSQLVQYYEIWGKYSYNLDQTWSSEAQFTPTPGSTIFDSFQPSTVQSTYGVKPIWVFYTSNYNEPNYDIYAVQSAGVSPVHDVTITATSASSNLGPAWNYPGGLPAAGLNAVMTITVSITNIGDYVENPVAVTLSVWNTTTVYTNTLKNLVGPGSTTNYYFYWNTTNSPAARYSITVTMAALPGETFGNLPDNNLSVSYIMRLYPVGDVDQDGSITVNDASIAKFDYGTMQGALHWNQYVDIDNDNFIGAVDVAFVFAHYGIFN